jgi:hypothetical protein
MMIFKLDIERCGEVRQGNGVLLDLTDQAEGQLPGGGKESAPVDCGAKYVKKLSLQAQISSIHLLP